MATITVNAHKNLEDFMFKVAELAASGEFFDASKWPRHYYGNRPYSAFPSVEITTTTTRPADSGNIASSGDLLYTNSYPQSFGQFLNDFQVAVANGRTFEGLILTDYRLKPYFRSNARMGTAKAKVTAVGQTQYSANGTSSWSNSIPDGILTAGTAVSFYIRTNPSSVQATDDGSYDYQFSMVPAGSGGLTLTNDPTIQNKAHITGTVPADQAGATFSVNTTVVDSYGTSVTGTALSKIWA